MYIPSLEDIEDGWKPTSIKPGHKIGKAKYLFSNIDVKKADEWREMFGGTQAERQKKKEEAAKLQAKKAAAKAKKDKKKPKQDQQKEKEDGHIEVPAKRGAGEPVELPDRTKNTDGKAA